jgi:adenylate kinase
MRFILGAPCSGKGTITSNLPEIKSLSAGNFLRDLCETHEYAFLKETLNSGGLVATDLICDILIKEAEKYNFDVFIDGFPRTIEQAVMIKKFMDSKNIICKGIFYIYVPEEILFERVQTRTYCKECHYTDKENIDHCEVQMIRRADDNPETLMKRLEVFNENINGILRVMEGPIFMVDNNRKIAEVIQNMKRYL